MSVSVRMDNMTQSLSDIVAKLDLVVLRPNSGWIVIQVTYIYFGPVVVVPLQYPEFLASWVGCRDSGSLGSLDFFTIIYFVRSFFTKPFS